MNTGEVSEARLGNACAHAVADAEAEVFEEAEGLAELVIVVGVKVCVRAKDAEPIVMTDALEDTVVDTLETTAGLLEDDTGALLCTLAALLETTVTIVEDGVAYGGRFRFGVAVGQLSMHGLINFAPCT